MFECNFCTLYEEDEKFEDLLDGFCLVKDCLFYKGEDIEGEFSEYMCINYCPVCGRNLEEKK